MNKTQKILSAIIGDNNIMRKKHKVLLAIIGGVDIVFYTISPILIATIWLTLVPNSLSAYILFIAALLSSLFRGIKIGFLKNKE